MSEILLAEAVIRAKLDTSQLDKQIRTIGSASIGLGRAFGRISNTLALLSAPLIAAGTKGFLTFLKTTDPLAIKTNKSLKDLKESFKQFMARVGERVVVKFDLVKMFERLSNVLKNIKPGTIDKFLSIAKWLAISTIITKMISQFFLLTGTLSKAYTALNKLSNVNTSTTLANGATVNTGLGIAGSLGIGGIAGRNTAGRAAYAAVRDAGGTSAAARKASHAAALSWGGLTKSLLNLGTTLLFIDGAFKAINPSMKGFLDSLSKFLDVINLIVTTITSLMSIISSVIGLGIRTIGNLIAGMVANIVSLVTLNFKDIPNNLSAMNTEVEKDSLKTWGNIFDNINGVGNAWNKLFINPPGNKDAKTYDFKEPGKFSTVGLGDLGKAIQDYTISKKVNELLGQSNILTAENNKVISENNRLLASKATGTAYYSIKNNQAVFTPRSNPIGEALTVY